MSAYYNEFDPYAAQWLRNLIEAGRISAGDVDTRSIEDVTADDLKGYDQHHFFAGIGGWSLALRLAGWPDDRPVWTGSCPCQPFSAAGKGKGAADERHLWPAWFWLIEQCRPRVVFGEQVEAAIKHGWLDLVQTDLEGIGYAVGAVGLPAASVGAPHQRARLWFVADAERRTAERWRHDLGAAASRAQDKAWERQRVRADVGAGGDAGELADRQRAGLEGHVWHVHDRHEPRRLATDAARPVATSSWSRCDWLPCRDGKARPVEPGIFPLSDGLQPELARVRALEIDGLEKVNSYAEISQSDPGEVLRALRDAVQSQEGRKTTRLGMLQQLYAPEVLFDYVLCLEAARDGAADRSGFEKAGEEVKHRIVRGVRRGNGDCGASRERGTLGQHAREPTDPLLSLSLVLARDAETYRQAAVAAHAASGRVGILRGAGNAIVPQVAAEVIYAYMEGEQ